MTLNFYSMVGPTSVEDVFTLFVSDLKLLRDIDQDIFDLKTALCLF